MRWDAERYRQLLLERNERQTQLSEVSEGMTDLYNTDGWDTKPKLGERFILMERQHAKLDREVGAIKADITALEQIRPRETQTLDDGSDILFRFLSDGNNGLESGEIRDHQASLEASGMKKMPSNNVLDLSKVPGLPEWTQGREAGYRMNLAQVVSDAAGTHSVQPAVQIDVMPTLIERMKYFGGASRFAYQFDTPSDVRPVKYPLDDDTAIGEIIRAQAAAATEQDAGLDDIEFEVFRGSSKYIDLSLEVFNSLGINVEEWMRNKLMRRLGRAWDNDFTNYATAKTGLLAAIQKGITVTAADATENLNVSWENLVDIQYKVDRGYREPDGEAGTGGFRPLAMGQTGYLISDEVERRVKVMKDGRNRPLWLPATGSAMGVFPGTLFGYPYAVLGSAPTPVANSFMASFGNFSYYGIRNAMGPLLFSMMDSTTITKYAARYIAYWWRGGQPIANKYDAAGAVDAAGNYEFASAIYAANQ